MVEDFMKNDSKARPANCSAGFFRLGEISIVPFCLVAPAALALHGHKKATQAAHLRGWPVGATSFLFERRN